MKKLDQSVFVGAPEWAEWVSTDFDGETWFHEIMPTHTDDFIWFVADAGRIEFAGMFETTDWKNSLIRRDHCHDCPNKTDGVCCGQAV